MEGTSKRKNWTILVVVSILIILQQCDKNAISIAAVPISKEFGFSSAQMGLIISSFFISYCAMNIIGGYITDMFGSRKVILAVVFLWSIFTGITGSAWSFTSLLVIRFLFGAAEGGFPPTNSLLIAELFPVEKRAFPKSFLSASGSLGVAVASIAITMITTSFGWRKAFWIYCFMGFIVLAIFAWVSKDMKRKADESGKIKPAKVPFKELLKISLLWKLVPMQFAVGTFMWGLNSWMPSYWMNVKGLKLVAMGVAASIPQITSFIAMICLGLVMDKYMMGREKIIMGTSALIAGIAVYLTFIAPTVTIGVLFMSLSSICMGILMQTNMICVIKYFPKETIGSGSGIVNFGNQFAGIVAPSIMGFIITLTNGSYGAVFGFVIFILAIAFVISLTVNTKEAAKKVLANSAAASKNQVKL